eukprot:Phypoly_transcript_01026.p1 GENE.Phypoly_transcript_01026~~Phypoly_transcript_01026.p1  ORF type:complete len:602 (-),score=117.83 Phypoly_transcript_01026:69-1874(-)
MLPNINAGNEIGDTGAMSIAFLMKNNTNLRVLRLRYNKITAVGATCIGEALKENNTLAILDLAWNSVGDKGATAFVNALKINTTLAELDLSENKVSQSILDEIKRILHAPDRNPSSAEPPVTDDDSVCDHSFSDIDSVASSRANSPYPGPSPLPVNKEVDMLMSNLRLEKEKSAKELARLREENAEFRKRAQEKEREWVEVKMELQHTLLENNELKKENRTFQQELSEFQEKNEAMRSDVTQAARVLAFELENVRYQENKLAQELKELKAREEYLRDQFAGHDSFLHNELLKIGEEKSSISAQISELAKQRVVMEQSLVAAEENKELELLQLSKDIENLKSQSKGQGDYDLTRSFQDLKKSKQIEQEMEKQLQDAQQRTRGREQVLLKQLEIFKIHGYTAERRALIALLRNTKRLLKKNRVTFKKVFMCYAWYDNAAKNDELQLKLKTLKEDLSLICHAVWLDLYNDDSSKSTMRAGIGESDNVIVIGTPPLKKKAENSKGSISMELFTTVKKHETKRGSVIPLLYEGTANESFPPSLTTGFHVWDFTSPAKYTSQLVEVSPSGVIPALYPLLFDSSQNGLAQEYSVVLDSFKHEITITQK